MNFLNTLFVITSGAYVHKDHQNVVVEVERQEKLRVPLHGLGSIACFGNVMVSPQLMAAALKAGICLVFFSEYGRLLGFVDGFGRGSLLLRRAQYRFTEDGSKCVQVARGVVSGKALNCRQVLARRSRETKDVEQGERLRISAQRLGRIVQRLQPEQDIQRIRGFEGDAARVYFASIDDCIVHSEFPFEKRTRRPPKNPVNALLSFAYALLAGDCVAALFGVGLDPSAGFLHVDRPGRPSLALDLMEELRPVIADRLVLALLNRSQIKKKDFEEDPTGGVRLKDKARKEFLASYQQRKVEEVQHPFLKKKIPWAIVPHVQARLLARYLRGDLEAYPPFVLR